MKYIRTKDGRIISYEVINETDMSDDFIYGYGAVIKGKKEGFEIEKIANTIEELIMPGDLVRYDGLYMSWVEKDRGDKVRGIDMHLIPRKSVDMLWIPTGNDTECYPNFKLVASKEDEKGKLELL